MTTIETLRFWCQKVLPLVYDDSLSYYELLCKVVKKTNEIINTSNTQSDTINALSKTVNELDEIVDGLVESLIDIIVPWNSEVAYRIYSIVEYEGSNYIAIQNVPVGIMITNTEYWVEANTVIEQINAIGATVTRLENEIGDSNIAVWSDIYTVNRHSGVTDKIPYFVIRFTGAPKIDWASKDAQTYAIESNHSAWTNGALIGPYVNDGTFVDNTNEEALYYVGWTTGTDFQYKRIYDNGSFDYYTEEELLALGDYGISIFSPLVINGERWVPQQFELNAVLANNKTFNEYIYSGYHPRTILGTDGEYTYFIVIPARTSIIEGVDYDDMYNIVTTIGLTSAFNLDGGGNSVLGSGKTLLSPLSTYISRPTHHLYFDEEE